tara:strand:+ start:126 stop:1058 length:933 start_codon:yes stop_codon:yes gene_type:complete
MLISIVIPSYNSSKTILRTIDSIFIKNNKKFNLEVIVVDDGSDDSKQLKKIINKYNNIILLTHTKNRGMCAARNTGIKNSKGEVVIILDADDVFVPGWFNIFRIIHSEWPKSSQVCFSLCKNQQGILTAENPNFKGFLELKDILNEKNSGEYLPIFRGQYIRKSLYTDIGTKKSCGIISYIKFALDSGPIWVSDKILRIYYENQFGSITNEWTSEKKAQETVLCYQNLFNQYGKLYVSLAPNLFKLKKLKLAIYMRLSKHKGYWKVFFEGASFTKWKETLVVGLMLLSGIKVSSMIAKLAKKLRFVRRYG